jgi:phosphatidylserine/phosphatidylglycerophosphate/cardiolipin synthase-like enzyme
MARDDDGVLDRKPWIRPIFAPTGPLLTEKQCLPFSEPKNPGDYLTYVAAPTTGRVTPMINGRDANGSGQDKIVVEAFNAMQTEVAALKSGDSVYLAGWMFNPAVPLTLGPVQNARTWGELFAARASAGVRVCVLLNEFDSHTPFFREIRGYIAILDKLIGAMQAKLRPNLQYQVTKHPVSAASMVLLGSHHQKFMVVKQADATIAFCGGLDIATLRTPFWWNAPGLAAWHDIHFRLDGLIARDLELEFVLRWNREQGRTDIAPRKDWGKLVILKQEQLGRTDQDRERNIHRVQMSRTISVNRQGGVFPPEVTTSNDIWQAYEKIIGCASQFLYMENQYFREFELADVIARRAREAKELKVIIIVPATLDEGSDPITEHGNAMQYKFFQLLTTALGPSRLRVYSMLWRFIHSKFILTDDAMMSVGSANANRRGFRLDSELNVTVADYQMVGAFRQRLWSHDLGVPVTTIAGWKSDEFFGKWDAIAASNLALTQGKSGAALAKAVADSAGECVVPFDYRTVPGVWSRIIPDDLAELGLWDAGDEQRA